MTTNAKQILKVVCNYYNLKLEELQSETRLTKIVHARHIYSFLSKENTKEKAEYIGVLINRDRSTVIHSFNKISSELKIYKDLNEEINALKEIIFENKLIIKDIDLLALSINYTNSFINV